MRCTLLLLLFLFLISYCHCNNNDNNNDNDSGSNNNNNNKNNNFNFKFVVTPSKHLFPTVLVHGGADNVEDIPGKYEGTRAAVRRGYQVLVEEGGSAMDAVVEAIKILEDHPAFKAGRGSDLSRTGNIEMDASIMDGVTMKAGAVAAVTNLRNPIEAARAVMERTPHVLLVGDKATQWAVEQGMETAEEEGWLITDAQYINWLQWLADHNMSVPVSAGGAEKDEFLAVGDTEDKWSHQKGTVGAVVIDHMGNIVAGTSTGGWVGKVPGRVGDTPGVGHGVYADNMAAGVSCTGEGEAFIKAVVAHRVSLNIGVKNMVAVEAIEEALAYMAGRVGGTGGVIAISRSGQMGIGWNSNQMSWAYGRDGELHYGVNPGEDFVEDINEITTATKNTEL